MQVDGFHEGRPRKRRRVIVGCQSCRTRHLKCDTNLPACARCVKDETKCVRTGNIRFKNLNASKEYPNVAFLDDQVWVQPDKNIRYYDETQDIVSMYEAGYRPEDCVENSVDSSQGHGIENAVAMSPAASLPQLDITYSRNVTEDLDGRGIVRSPNSHSPGLLFQSQETPANLSYPPDLFDFPEHLDSCHNSENVLQCSRLPVARLSSREAFLLRNFIENMALWADVTDLERHFEVEVPRRALEQPVLRLAIFAFSARHINRKFDCDETEALQYHNECLQLLIPTLSIPDTTINEDFLAAIAILRQYEEMDAYDNRCHLIGTTRILNSISTFGSSGGLGEAVAWLCLRQDIYVSLVSQQPLRTSLDNYLASKSIQRKDDVSWANQMVFLLAKVLTCAFLPDQGTSTASLQQMNEEVELWNASKPATFAPIRFIGRSREENRPFPEVWLLSAFHVVALQYYHIAKLVLAVSTRGPQTSGYENLRQGRKIEKAVRNHLLVIIGLASSNKTAENTLFTARHALSVWGGVLRDKVEQDGAVLFLMDMEKRTGWRASPLIQSLQDQWDEDGEAD